MESCRKSSKAKESSIISYFLIFSLNFSTVRRHLNRIPFERVPFASLDSFIAAPLVLALPAPMTAALAVPCRRITGGSFCDISSRRSGAQRRRRDDARQRIASLLLCLLCCFSLLLQEMMKDVGQKKIIPQHDEHEQHT